MLQEEEEEEARKNIVSAVKVLKLESRVLQQLELGKNLSDAVLPFRFIRRGHLPVVDNAKQYLHAPRADILTFAK